jgi:hypothetical protein
MGKLLTLNDFREDEGRLALWYFKDAYYDGYSNVRGYTFKWPSDAFPHCVSIHEDDLGDNRPEIRKWIEQHITGTVIYGTKNNSYRVWYSSDPTKRSWDHTSEIYNTWSLFYFEDGEDALAFRLRFNDIVKPMTADHPTKHYGERYHR